MGRIPRKEVCRPLVWIGPVASHWLQFPEWALAHAMTQDGLDDNEDAPVWELTENK